MTSQKFIAFMEKLLTMTKTGEIVWSRCQNCPDWASAKKSFSCIAGTMNVDLYTNDDLDIIAFCIEYDPSMPCASLDANSNEERQIALRLVNYIYDLFPNLEKSIDQFLDGW